MSKNMLQDIKPLTKTSIARVRSSHTRTHTEEPVFTPIHPRSSSRHILWFIAVPAIVALLFSMSFIFSGATVTITPKVKTITLEDTVTAFKDSNEANQVSFMVMSLSGDETVQVPGETTGEATEKSTGTVVIYNEYSTSSQALVATTRLETSDGKIYRINKQVTVPGFTTSGTVVTPGSVEVSVTADQAGEKYNIGPSDFTIPGFAGSAKFSKFYARSKGSMTGGSTGVMHMISETAAQAAQDSLVEKAKTNLTQQLSTQVPEGFLLYPDLTFFESDDTPPLRSSKDPTVTITLHSTITALLIDQDSLVESLSKSFTAETDNGLVTMPELSSATVALADTATLDPASATEISFSITGAQNAHWTIDETALVASLVGQAKKDFQSILAVNPSVDTAELVLTPFWKNTLPTNTKDIKVIVK